MTFIAEFQDEDGDTLTVETDDGWGDGAVLFHSDGGDACRLYRDEVRELIVRLQENMKRTKS